MVGVLKAKVLGSWVVASALPPYIEPTPVVPAWIPFSYSTGWSNYGPPFNPGQYRKIGDEVYLRGLLNQVPGAGGTVMQLPVGYRPAGQNIAAQLASTGMARYDIQTDGFFTTSATISNGNWICMDNIHFSVTP
jgi:hypothetical protein